MSFDHYKIWDAATSIGVLRSQKTVPKVFLKLFDMMVESVDEYIDFADVAGDDRRLAPFVVPMADGEPVYRLGTNVSRFKTAYIKMKDAVSPKRVIKRMISAPRGSSSAMSKMAQYNAIKAGIIAQHLTTLENRKEVMAARALLDAKLVISGPNYPEVTIDFERDADHDVVLADGAQWSDDSVSIIDSLQGFLDTVQIAENGGHVDVAFVTTEVHAVLRKDIEVRRQLDETLRGTMDTYDIGLMMADEVVYAGKIGPVSVFVYSGYYEEDGEQIRIMKAGEILLVASKNLMGHQCFGAIQDVRAGFMPMDVFVRNWLGSSDSAEQIETQSAPLMVPLNPNCTLRAKVV